MEDIAKSYLNMIEETEEFKRLIELKNIINNKYSNLIISFKTLQSEYDSVKEYSQYRDLSDIRNRLSIAKANLYNKDEVKEYIELENKIDKMINDDLNEIKKSISNKFITNEKII